jgi:hypothetical protein
MNNVGANTVYRRAILKALESLNDFQSRSSIDAIRRLSQDILEDVSWNETLFVYTIKSIVKDGDIELLPNALAELSPDFKRKRVDSLLKMMEDESMNDAPQTPQLIEPPMPPQTSNTSSGTTTVKVAPKRRREHEKWKIIPKKEYDKST